MKNPNSFSDFEAWEAELDQGEPYGADMLVDLTPEAAVGVLACINGLDTPGADDAQPYPPGSGAIDDASHSYESAPAEDVTSLL